MKRGDAAREAVREKIAEAFGAGFRGVQDKKLYVEVEDGPGGEIIQFAITLTMPKNPVEFGAATEVEHSTTTPTRVSDEDKKKIDELMAKLGL